MYPGQQNGQNYRDHANPGYYANGQPYAPTQNYNQSAESAQNAFPLFHHSKPENVTAESFIPAINLSSDKAPGPLEGFQESFQDPSTMAEVEDIDAEMDEVFVSDEGLNPFLGLALEARRIAEDFLHVIKTNFPNRFFILKRITQNPEFWEICLQKSYVIINDDNYTKKLQNCFEVNTFPFQLVYLLTYFS